MKSVRFPSAGYAILLTIMACRGRGADATASDTSSVSGSAPSAALAPSAPPLDKFAGGEPLLIAGKPTGYVKLPSGLLVRREVQSCPSQLPTAGCPKQSSGTCRQDSDCKQGTNAYCHRRGLENGCNCDYGCLNDSECHSGQVCVCSNPVGVCVDAVCDDKTACAGVCGTFFKDGQYVPMACREKADAPTRSD